MPCNELNIILYTVYIVLLYPIYPTLSNLTVWLPWEEDKWFECFVLACYDVTTNDQIQTFFLWLINKENEENEGNKENKKNKENEGNKEK